MPDQLSMFATRPGHDGGAPRTEVHPDVTVPPRREGVSEDDLRARTERMDAAADQEAELGRVSDRIASVILDFYADRKPGDQFHGVDIERAVMVVAGGTPGSGCRVMRDLKKKGLLNYKVAKRSESLYEILPCSTALF